MCGNQWQCSIHINYVLYSTQSVKCHTILYRVIVNSSIVIKCTKWSSIIVNNSYCKSYCCWYCWCDDGGNCCCICVRRRGQSGGDEMTDRMRMVARLCYWWCRRPRGRRRSFHTRCSCGVRHLKVKPYFYVYFCIMYI